MKRKGGWELLFPAADQAKNEQYEDMLKAANDLWDEFTTGKGKRESMMDRKAHGSKTAHHKNTGSSLNRFTHQSNVNLKPSQTH